MKPNFAYSVPFDITTKKADIFHGTNFTYTPIVKGKTVITIHDLAYMKYPETTSERIYKHHSNWVPWSARKCDRIIADSHQTKADITELLGIPGEKIDVIHLAADERFRPMSTNEVRPVLDKYHLPPNYILFVGTLEPRKNLLGLLKAYYALKQNCDYSEKLVIVGAKGWKFSPIFQWIEEKALQEDVIFTGFVDDADLPALYNGSAVFVLPSIYEGFGLPILEAMNCGIPVIASNRSSIPEVAGSAGILLDPEDHENWAMEMHQMLTVSDQRKNYSALSLEQGKKFTWKRTAYETKQVYDKLLNNVY
jgi:glycosyltransferase involved in cell wall biosynthesis